MTDLRITQIDGGQGTLEGKVVDAWKTTLRGPLLRFGDPGYDDVRQIWNGMMDKRPALIARCQGTTDVINAINFGRDNGILLAVRGGGHNVAGHSSCDGGLMIDLSLMNGVRVDARAGIVRAQGGCTLGDLDAGRGNRMANAQARLDDR